MFQQPWWLDAVAPGRWTEVTVSAVAQTVARLPFVVRGPRPMRVLTQPPLTPFLGPWVARSPTRSTPRHWATRWSCSPPSWRRGCRAAAMFRQSFSPEVIDVLPFIWGGYRAEVRYTYRLEGLGSEEALWDGLSGNIRREIRKARARVEVRDDLGLDRFHAVWAKTFDAAGAAPSRRSRWLERVDAACGARGAAAMLFACDGAGRVHAVAYIVWDARCGVLPDGRWRPGAAHERREQPAAVGSDPARSAT